MARIQINGMPGIGTSVYYPLVNTDNLFDVVDTWSKLAGKHVYKWGVEIHRNRMDRFQPQGLNLGPYGSLYNSLASFLLGATQPDLYANYAD